MAVEAWRLNHPKRGMLEVLVGSSEELREYDPNFPDTFVEKVERENEEEKESEESFIESDSSTRDPEVADSGSVDAVASKDDGAALRAELKEATNDPGVKGKIAQILSEISESYRVLVRQDRKTIARLKNLTNVKISLDKSSNEVDDGKFGYETTISEPFLQLTKNFTGAYLVEVVVKTRGELVKFDPPAGSRAAAREKAMEESPTKRWLYPLLSGLGKGGWALVVFVIGPLISKVIDLIWSLIEPFIPDWELPSIPWPHIDWPEIHLPSIPWPHINWPHIDLPDWQMPEWLRPVLHAIGVAMDYSKIWMPIVVGLVVGILAVRRNRKSESAKEKWGESSETQVTANECDGDSTTEALKECSPQLKETEGKRALGRAINNESDDQK